MNELQQKAIDELSKKNEKYIKEIDQLYNTTKKKLDKYNKFEEDFWELMGKMEKANSTIPFVPFNNYYCVINDSFGIASAPLILDDLYGTLNEEYLQLSEDGMRQIEEPFEKEAKELLKDLTESAGRISDLIPSIIASNSIIRRLSGLDDKYTELVKLGKTIWYPQKISRNAYTIRGQYAVPMMLMRSNVQMQLPFQEN